MAPLQGENPRENLGYVECSGLFVHPDGTEHTYPTLDDYVAQLVRQEAIASEDDLFRNTDNDEIIQKILFHWSRYTFAGCLFAAHLARDPIAFKWSTAVVRAFTTPDELRRAFAERMSVVSRLGKEALQFVIPDIREPKQIVDLINRLCSMRGWYWIRIMDHPAPTNLVHVGLRCVLPTNDHVVAHVLGMAPFGTMPPTRRAPFTTLLLRPSAVIRRPPSHIDSARLLEDGRVAVHLADMASPLPGKVQHERVWKKTELLKLQRLGENPPDARARVTFSLSPDDATNLVPPRDVGEVLKIPFDEAEQLIRSGNDVESPS